MARLTWDAIGKRFYETGIDQGVLYVGTIGVAWPGLISVSERASGGEPRPYYIDGFKYLNLSSAEEFEADIASFSSPAEFAQCDGRASIQNGLFATQQPRKEFNFSYRTKVGNDLDGSDHAYKIHLVYNALAAPTERQYSSIGDSADPTELSWSISTRPPMITGYKPTAHFVIDSRSTPTPIITAIEDIIYGSESLSARMPTVQELMAIFTGLLPLEIVEIEPDVWQIRIVSTVTGSAVMSASQPAYFGQPILWLNTSEGDYVVPTLVTGD